MGWNPCDSQKLAATTNRREGVYNRTGKPSVTFCEREGAGSGRMFFLQRKRSKQALLRRGGEMGYSNPRSRFNGLHDFQSCSFDQLGHLSIEYCIFRTPDYYIQIIVECQGKNAKFHKKTYEKIKNRPKASPLKSPGTVS